MQRAIPYMQLRGGSSKGLYFNANDLPPGQEQRDQVLMAAMCGVGPGDPRQIDGLGGGNPLTSKAAIVSPSSRPDADIEFEFVQVVIGGTDRSQNCGNILAGVVPFAIEAGMLPADDGETVARVYMSNSGAVCEVIVQTPGRQVEYAGEARVDGVPGTAAPVICNYGNIAGSACGALLPTGNLIDCVDGVEVTCIDNGMPVVLLRAADVGLNGYEIPDELNRNDALKERLESIRLQIGPKMNLGNVLHKVVPKITLLAAPIQGGLAHTRTFIPHVCHAAIGVLGAVSVATGCIIPGTVAQGLAEARSDTHTFSIEHPSGEFSVLLEIDDSGPRPSINKAGVLRTARLLSRGVVFLPAGVGLDM